MRPRTISEAAWPTWATPTSICTAASAAASRKSSSARARRTSGWKAWCASWPRPARIAWPPGSAPNKRRPWPGTSPRPSTTAPSARPPAPPGPPAGRVVVSPAGPSDLPVAREAVNTARAMGCTADLLADVGVAGIHRLLRHREQFAGADVIVVVAGMDGALPSVVGGLVDCPVIAVPTSVGYGAAFAGLAPLLTMLNSCSAHVVVVNIDSGFKGGYVAALIARRAAQGASKKE